MSDVLDFQVESVKNQLQQEHERLKKLLKPDVSDVKIFDKGMEVEINQWEKGKILSYLEYLRSIY